MPKPRNMSRVPALEPAGPLQASIGAIFKAKRRAARPKVNLVDMAKHLGCAINTVRWHEAGTRMMRVDDIVRAAAFLGCAFSDLMPDDPVPDPEPAPVPVTIPPRRPPRVRGKRPSKKVVAHA